MTQPKKIIERIWSKKAEAFKTEKDPWLDLNRLNIFIGPNNSGKSLFTRLLLSSNHNELTWHNSDTIHERQLALLTEYAAHISEVPRTPLKPPVFNFTAKELEESGATKWIRNLSELITEEEFTKTKIMLDQLLKHLNEKFISSEIPNSFPFNSLHTAILELKVSDLQDPYKIPERKKPNLHYIPILRGLRPLTDSTDNHYDLRTKKDYSIACGTHTGLELFDLITSKLLGEPEDREKIKGYENLLSENFFNGASVSLVPKVKTDTLHVRIGMEKQRPIYDLGDGLQTVIIVTAAAYFTEAPSIFVIEEPETHLHPGFQRRLIEVLLNETSHQYLITTHSNHLLELGEFRNDINIFRTSKIPSEKTVFQIKSCGHDRDLLRELGVNPASVYLANCTIWVEGITDRLYIQAFLDQYKRDHPGKHDKWLENYHYVFVEYQGGGLAHWEFSEASEEFYNKIKSRKATPDMLVIADSDIKSKSDRFDTLNTWLAEKLYTTPGKEIDNMIPNYFIKSWVKDYLPTMRDGNKELIRLHNIKEENIEPLMDLTKEKKGIGWHIDRLLFNTELPKNSLLLFRDKSGTLKADYKMKLCIATTEKMRSEPWNMTPEIKALCEMVFSHIAENNQ